jgi:hypothetical protein
MFRRTLPKPPQVQDVEPTPAIERRAFVRHRRRLESFWQLLGVRSTGQAGGEVFDLSVTGVGLIVNQEFPPDAVLVLRLPTMTQGWNTHLVRVRRCERLNDGRYQVGCAFVKPLTAGQLQTLLQGRKE